MEISKMKSTPSTPSLAFNHLSCVTQKCLSWHCCVVMAWPYALGGYFDFFFRWQSLRVLENLNLLSVRFAVGVSMVHVLAVGAGVREAFEAFAALEGFFSRVQSLVFSQMVLMFEGFWAFLAFVWALTCG